MKKTLILLTISLSISTASHAQKWSAGYRTGFQQLQNNPSYGSYKNGRTVWSNQVFLDRKISKRFESELTLGYSYKNHGSSTHQYFDGPALVTLDQQTTTLTMGVYLRYYMCQHSRLRVFGQAGFTSYKSWTNYQGQSYDYPISLPQYFSGRQNSGLVIANTVAAGVGVNYEFRPRFYLNSVFNLNYYTSGSIRMADDHRFAGDAHVGIGLRF